MMVIENSDGVGSYYSETDSGEVVVRPVVCNIAKAEAVATDGSPDHFVLTDPAVVLIMARDDDLFEIINVGIIQSDEPTPTTPKPICTIGRNDVRRIARRGGTKRMRAGFTAEVNEQLREYLRSVIHDTTAIAEMRGKKTVRLEDVLHVLQRRGHPMYT
jgi:histone H3/H4